MNHTQQQILEFLRNTSLGPSEIANKLSISRQALHRHLKVLLKSHQIEKYGTAPHVTYSLKKTDTESRVKESKEYFEKYLLPKYLEKEKIQNSYSKFEQLKNGGSLNEPDFNFMLSAAALYSSNIEGNSLSLNSFLNSQLQPKKLRPKEAQEVEDLVEAYIFSRTCTLNDVNMRRAHSLLSKDFVNKARQGVYRNEPVGVFSNSGLVYLAIEAKYIDDEVKQLFEVIEGLLKKEIEPVEVFFWASWLHLMMVLIHPFSDGNGRISRLCEKWFLREKLGSFMLLLPSEEYYFKERPRYYSSLRLGVNYWETNFALSTNFLQILPESLDFSESGVG